MNNKYTLIKYHLGRLSPTEHQQVKTWLQEPQNLKEYNTYIQLWKSSSEAKILEGTSIKSSWKSILSTTDKQPQPRLNWTKRWAIAALVVLSLGWMWLGINKLTEPTYIVIANTEISKPKKVILPDGSTVILNRNSKIRYPQKFNDKSRKIELWGNGFFEVKKNPELPFEVDVNHHTIQVLGTSFDINSTKKRIVVSVATGKVLVKDQVHATSITLLPNQRVLSTNGEMIQETITNKNYIAWKTKEYQFTNTPLAEVMDVLQKEFDFQYHFDDQALRNIPFSAHLNQLDLNQILSIIQISCQIQMNNNQNVVTISNYE